MRDGCGYTIFSDSRGRWTAAYPIVSIFSKEGKSSDSTTVESSMPPAGAAAAMAAAAGAFLPFPFPVAAASAAAATAFFRLIIAVFL